ncbi:MAG: IS110 family transposase [Actinobacteria bacterium]|nr:IS110 family transposase [Actinomycetota bacterium]
MIFVGDDWAEAHHDICIIDEAGKKLAKRRVPEGLDGVNQLHALVAAHASDPAEVVVGIETDRGLFVQALIAAGYQVYAINPLAASRYRERHSTSGAKSDPGDALVLAELVRTDRHNHRPVAGDSELAEAVKVLARAHQNLIWVRQRQLNTLRSTLREYYPAALEAFGDDLGSRDALAVLGRAPTPALGKGLSAAKIASAIRAAGRQRNVETRAGEIREHLRGAHLEAPAQLAQAYGATIKATVGILTEMNAQLAALEEELRGSFETHPDAEIILSHPGLGFILGARVLAEFGDDRTRYADARARKRYAGTAPITKASGKSKVVLARFARNSRLADACYLWAFAALSASPGARAFYDAHRAARPNDKSAHSKALRALANRLVGILHGCITHQTLYDEAKAWNREEAAA